MNVTINEESNLVQHAKRELELLGEDPALVKATLEIISIFSEVGHSGASASIHVDVIDRLLNFKNLLPLTDNPEEWHHHTEEFWGEEGGVWQNIRNGEAFSTDGGKSYYLLSETQTGEKVMHKSEVYKK